MHAACHGHQYSCLLYTSQKADDEVRFLEGVTAEHEGFAHSSRHMEKFKSNT